MKTQIISRKYRLTACFNCQRLRLRSPELRKIISAYAVDHLTNGFSGSGAEGGSGHQRLDFQGIQTALENGMCASGNRTANSGRMPPTQ
ncbi:hypothetical protein ABDX87_07080 [Pseudomonas abietaniphila]|uniref:hypothetical protein n=1 Tax=Pseudomonas abietaniphila TaxID=89065 RepID=UPI00321778B2